MLWSEISLMENPMNFWIQQRVKRSVAVVVAAVTPVLISACASSSPDVIQRGDAQRMAQVQDGVVLSVRNVVVDGSQSGAGAAVGGVVGAIGGYGGSGVQREAQVLGVLAGVAGAAAGNALERFATREEAVEILVQLKGGERRAIVQAKASEQLAAGDEVIIVTTGSKVRVTKAPK
jgi:outer membrane lipoprotein SlyB